MGSYDWEKIVKSEPLLSPHTQKSLTKTTKE
jgi:hypothetical protein